MAPGSASDEDSGSQLAAGQIQDDGITEREDVDVKLKEKLEKNKQRGPFGLLAPVVWPNVLVMAVFHFLAVWGILAGAETQWKTWVFFLTYYLFSGIGVTAGAHRLWAHKTYKATLPFQVLLMCFNCISMQNDILEWSRDHRVHHKYTETHADPHNAKRGFFFAHMGWLLMRKHPDVLIKGKNVDLSDLKRDPVVMFQHRYYLPLCFLFTLFLPTFVPWYFWGESIKVGLLVMFCLRYVLTLHSTWLVNSAAHLWGSRPYDQTMHPSDNRFVCIAAIGEGHHNYHHTFPYDYATSEWGPKLNMTTIVLDLCAALGLVYDRKQVSQEAIERVRRRLGDLSTAQYLE